MWLRFCNQWHFHRCAKLAALCQYRRNTRAGHLQFYLGYVLALGFGSFIAGYMDVAGNSIPILATFIVALAMIPVGLTRLPSLMPPEAISVDLRTGVENFSGWTGGHVYRWRRNHADAILCTNLYHQTRGFSAADVGLLMFLMQLGLLVVQMPMGALSDRIDRRIVLAIVSAGARGCGWHCLWCSGVSQPCPCLSLMFSPSGTDATKPSIRFPAPLPMTAPIRREYVMLSSTQMIAWSIAAFIFPDNRDGHFAVYADPVLHGDLGYRHDTALFLVFVLYRMQRSKEVPRKSATISSLVQRWLSIRGIIPILMPMKMRMQASAEGLVH